MKQNKMATPAKEDHYSDVKSSTLKKLLSKFGINETQLENILVSNKSKVDKPIPLYLEKSEEYSFGLIADTHLCSNFEKMPELLTFYKLCENRGIKDVFHAGDILAGQDIFPGQEYEVHTFGADNQINYVVNNYPKIDGITTHFILGNHDFSFFKRMGIDVGKIISLNRPDMNYLGQFRADIMFGDVKLIQLVHPDGGMPYAMSYRAQKYVEQIASGTKPRVLALGHLHTNYFFTYRNIAVLGCGCFEGQSAFLLRKGINPVVGGWIVKIKLGNDRERSIISLVPEFIPFF